MGINNVDAGESPSEMAVRLRAMMADFMYASDVDDAFMLIDAMLRAEYVRGYNSAARQYGPSDAEPLKS